MLQDRQLWVRVWGGGGLGLQFRPTDVTRPPASEPPDGCELDAAVLKGRAHVPVPFGSFPLPHSLQNKFAADLEIHPAFLHQLNLRPVTSREQPIPWLLWSEQPQDTAH